MSAGARAESAVRRLADLPPVEVGADPALDDSLAAVGSDLGSRDVRAAALAVGCAGVVPASLAVSLLGPLGVGVATLSLGLFALAGYAVLSLPTLLATARRARALGGAPEVVGLAVLRARVAPTPEGTATFAAEHGRGPLAASLREHVRRARGAPGAGWESFVDSWSGDRGLARAVSLLRAGVDAPDAERGRLLDRAFGAALDGARERSASFAADARGPVGAVYAFGVVLPLALVAALPAAQGAGLPVSTAALAVVYDLLLPAGLLAACAWVLARRPAAFPPEPVPASHPDVPDRKLRTVAAALGAGALAALASLALLPAWTLATAPGVAAGAALVAWFRPVYAVRTDVTELEAGLPDALSLVGRRLGRGEPPETALAAAERANGPAGEAFAAAAGVQRRLRTGVREAFLGEYGALADVPSPRAHAAAELLALAAREGPHGGHVLVELADHIDDLRGVEDETRRELAGLVSTLRNTACCFAPLVGGVTVALAGRLAAEATGRFLEPIAVEPLGAVVGVYVLLLAALLAGFAAALERGLDRARIGYHVGIALLAAGTIYPVAAGGAGLLL
jgi:hypothetical protein